MKFPIQAVAVTVALIVPAASFAQSNGPVTRAQVRAELVQLEKVGYSPSSNDVHYPDDILAAEAKVAARHSAASGYGGVVSGSSDAGRPAVAKADWNAMYNHP